MAASLAIRKCSSAESFVQHGREEAVEVGGGFGLGGAGGAGALLEAVEPALGVQRTNRSPLSAVNRDSPWSLGSA